MIGNIDFRSRMLFVGAATSILPKLTSLLLNLLTVRWALVYMNDEQYALIVLVTTLNMFFNLADLGIGGNLVNTVSEGKSGQLSCRQILSAFTAQFFISLALTVLALVAYLVGFWNSLLQVPNGYANIYNETLSFAVFGYALNLVGQLTYKVLLGLQQTWRANILQSIANIATLAIVYYATDVQLSSSFVSLITVLVPAIFAVAYSIYFFSKWDLFLGLNTVDMSSVRQSISSSFSFFIIQLFAVLGNSSDAFILGRFLGLTEVTNYSLIQRVAVLLNISQLIIVPLWPAIGNAIAKGDWAWISKGLKPIVLWVTIGTGFSAAVFYFLAADICSVWLSMDKQFETSLLLSFVFFLYVSSFGGLVSSYLNCSLYLKRQAIMFASASLIALMAKILLVQATGEAYGLVWGANIGYGIFFVVPAAFYIKNEIRLQVQKIRGL